MTSHNNTLPRGTALVTGAARGMGYSCARALGQLGFPVLMCDLREEELEQSAARLRDEGVQTRTLAGDITRADTLATLASTLHAASGLAACVHAAGLSSAMASAERVLEVNLTATARLLDTLLPLANEGAATVCLASQAGHLVRPTASREVCRALTDTTAPDLHARLAAALGKQALDSTEAYGWSKLGVQLLIVEKARAFGERGARLLSLSPGIIDTPMGRQEYEQHGSAMQAILDITPLPGRWGAPEEIASVAAFLCSPGAAFMTGVDVLVDGGSTGQVLRQV